MNEQNTSIEKFLTQQKKPQNKSLSKNKNTNSSSNIYTHSNVAPKKDCKLTIEFKSIKSIKLLDGGVGCGKTTKMLNESIDYMLSGGSVIYAVHDINTQSERIQEFSDFVLNRKKITSEVQQRLIANTRKVNSKDTDDGEIVSSMFDRVVHELHGKPSIIFITTASLRLNNFKKLDPTKTNIYVDDDITGLDKTTILKCATQKEVQLIVDAFVHKKVYKKPTTDKENGYVIVKLYEKSDKFNEILQKDKNVDFSSRKKLFKSINSTLERNKNVDYFFKFEKKNGFFNVEQFSVMSTNIIDNFNLCTIAAENVKQDNTTVNIWLKNGVKFEYELLTYDNETRGKKFLYDNLGIPMIDVKTIAGNETYSITKATDNIHCLNLMNQTLQVAAKQGYKNIHASINSRMSENDYQSVKPLFDSINVTGTVTRGINSLMHCDASLMAGINKGNDYTIKTLCDVYGLDKSDLEEQITISAMVQNMGRGVLRQKQTVPCLLIFPDYYTACKSIIRFAKYYPELSPHVDYLIDLAGKQAIAEPYFSEKKRGRKSKYNEFTPKQSKVLLKLSSEYTADVIDEKLARDGVVSVLNYYEVAEKEKKAILKDQRYKITVLKKRVERFLKASDVKSAIEKAGSIDRLLSIVDGLNSKSIAEKIISITKQNSIRVDPLKLGTLAT